MRRARCTRTHARTHAEHARMQARRARTFEASAPMHYKFIIRGTNKKMNKHEQKMDKKKETCAMIETFEDVLGVGTILKRL